MLVSVEQRRVLACKCIHVGLSSLHDVMLDDLKEIIKRQKLPPHGPFELTGCVLTLSLFST